MKKDSKIYIAGHNGLVGTALLKNLKQKGYLNIKVKDSKDLDLRDSTAVKIFFERENPEYIFLAAAKVGGIRANNSSRGEFIYDNLMIQSNIINQSYISRVKKLLFLGSTCVYPRDCPQPIKEDYLLTGSLEYTNEPYAIAKIAGIKMCESYNIQYGTNFLSVMPTNLYGPKDNFNIETSHVIPALTRKIHLGKALENNDWEAIREDLKKLPIEGINETSSEQQIFRKLKKYGITVSPDNQITVEIWGSGKPLREFLWSEDMADACVFIMENRDFKDITLPAHRGLNETQNTHVNIGTGTDISISDLAALIKQTIGFTGKFVYNTSKPDGTMKKLTDVSKLHNLGWKHRVHLAEGIQKLYDWYLYN